ncbi:MAG: pyridoxal-phosphate dependent enzyme [Myxococcota bacterium]
MTMVFPTLADLQAARERIAGRAHETPVFTSRSLDAACDASLFIKCENFQKVGAFKFRGACNAIFALTEEEAANGVATHSSGNHAQAVALAASLRGVPAHVVMPTNAPAAKRAAVLGYGARVIDCAPTLEARETTLAKVVAETHAHEVHPYNDPFVVAGQGTAALELFEEVGPLDTFLVPVGGGGLMSGSALAAAAVSPGTSVEGCEPTLANDAAEGLRIGERQPPNPPTTIADGLRTALGPLSFAIMKTHVHTIHTVSEAEIVAAMRFVWERLKIVIEASSAVPFAVALRGDVAKRRVGIVVSGGNLDLDRLPWQEV